MLKYVLLPFLWVGVAMAQPVQLADTLSQHLGGPVDSIKATPLSGLYEVRQQGSIFYTDAKGRYLLQGNLYDLQARENLTERSRLEMDKALVKSLPTQWALKRQQGKGERIIYTFEDPNCGYCKRLYRELNKLENVTIYTFLTPILGRDSQQKVADIWCANDPVSAWHAWMLNGKTPVASKSNCNDPTAEVMRLARSDSIQLRGTPLLYLDNGVRVGGYTTADNLKKLLTSPPTASAQ